MNYLGHAFLALAHDRDPAYVLGAMLPDFASMARARLAPQPHAGVAAGVALHHRTDTAFHGHPTFLALVDHVTVELEALGVGRGTARAVGHIGVELLLDGELLGHEPLHDAYLAALQAAPSLPLSLRGEETGTRLADVCQRLATYGVPWDCRSPDGVTYRLGRALQGRPRLAPRPGDADPIRATLTRVQPAVRAASGELFEEVAAALRAPTHDT